MSRHDLSRRMTAVEAILRPAGSLAARLASLNPDERDRYEQWRTNCSRWVAGFAGPGDAYEAVCEDGFEAPSLDFDISRKLFGCPPRIRFSDSMDNARRKYEDMTR